MDKYKFGDYIYNKRKKLGLTQDELGKKLGVTNKAVSKWEVGETMPDITMLLPLATVLGVTVDELMSQQDKEKEEQVVITKQQKPYIYLIIIGIISLLFIAVLILYLITFIQPVEESVIINASNDNIKEIVDINPSYQIVCDEETLKIDSTYRLNENYTYNENVDLTFTIVYQYIYYYYLVDGTVGVVTYYNRFYDVVLNSEQKEQTISVLLEPKFDIDQFKGFNQVKISYIVLDALGSVVKNDSSK